MVKFLLVRMSVGTDIWLYGCLVARMFFGADDKR